MIKKGFTFLQSKKANTLLKFSNKAFTLVEVLVVIGILSIAGVLVLAIFSSTLRGNNKSQILISIKQNGQSVLETMTSTIRGADNLVCPANVTPINTLVVGKNGIYTRFRIAFAGDRTVPASCLSNGCIVKDNPVQSTDPDEISNPALFVNRVCDSNNTMPDPSSTAQVMTDTNSQTGVSVSNQSRLFIRNKVAGFKDGVTISFSLAPAKDALPSVAGQIDPVIFETTIQLR